MRYALILALLAACTEPAGDDQPPVASHVEFFEVPGVPPPRLDVLVVVEDTAAMAPYAERTAALLHELEHVWSATAPLPDLRVAVVTADPADAGHVRSVPSVHGAYLVDESSSDYLARVGNHDGTLADALVLLGDVERPAARPSRSPPHARRSRRCLTSCVPTPTSRSSS